MKNGLLILAYMICVLFYSNSLKAKDEIKIESKTKEEQIDLDITGILKVSNSGSSKKYYIETKDKLEVILPDKIVDKEISFLPYENKKVLVKGKGKKVINKDGITTNINLLQLLSIELKDVAPGAEKRQPSDQIIEKEKSKLGNQSDN